MRAFDALKFFKNGSLIWTITHNTDRSIAAQIICMVQQYTMPLNNLLYLHKKASTLC